MNLRIDELETLKTEEGNIELEGTKENNIIRLIGDEN